MSENILTYHLESFDGPLDLLLQLISRNKMNIYDIQLTVLFEQYMEQIEAMREQDMEVASEFLEMAARLIYMKTVSLLPRHEEIEQLKQELTGELLEYQVCREMAQKLEAMTGGFDGFVRKPAAIEFEQTYELIHKPDTVYLAYLAAVGRGQRKLPPSTAPFTKLVARKIFAVSTKIVFVMRSLWHGGTKTLSSLYSSARSRSELIATFLAVLELCKANRVEVSGDGDNTEITLNRGHKHK